MLGRYDGVRELIRRSLLTPTKEPPGDRGTDSHKMVRRVERAEYDPLPVGIAPVKPVGLGDRAMGLITPVVEIIRERELVNGQAPNRVAGEVAPYRLGRRCAAVHCPLRRCAIYTTTQ